MIDINELRFSAANSVGDLALLPSEVLELLDRLEAAEKARDDVAQQLVQSEQGKRKISKECESYKAAYNDWTDKTEWVQQGFNEGTISAKYLGLHRADVMARLLDEAEKERDALLDRLEAAEKELAELRSSMKFRTSLIGRTEAECEQLRAKIERMEQQEPARLVTPTAYRWRRRGSVMWQYGELTEETVQAAKEHNHEVQSLYALPGAQPAPKAVAYLDLGTGGYMDIGTDLTDEALAALPKGRHMLGIVGTYGVDGYVPAQPAPSVPREAIEKMLTQLMDIAVSNGANSVSMPDEYVEVAAWLCGIPERPAPSINEGVRKVTLGFRWESEAQHHIPTIEIEFDPVSPESPNDAKGWQDRDRIASMLSPEAKS